MNSDELQLRLKKLAYRTIPLCEAIPKKKICVIVEDQLLRSGFSAAANYCSACKAQSQKSFTSKLSIVFEEIDETLFWLEVIGNLLLLPVHKLVDIKKEADELTRILAA